jgi:MFS family permease
MSESNKEKGKLISHTEKEFAKDLDKAEKTKLLTCIMTSQVVCGTLYLSISSFFPLFVEAHYPMISSTMVSICMSSFEVAGVLFTPVHAITISKMGRKNSIIFGFSILVFTTTSLGLLSYIPYDHWKSFYYLATIVRFMQGYGDTLIMTTCFSVVGTKFPEQKETYISLMEAAVGLGLIVGPPMGSVIYGLGGYAWTFYAFALIITANVILCLVCLPADLNKESQKHEVVEETVEGDSP